MKVESIFIFPNRMVVVFDSNGNQIPRLQGVWEEVEELIRIIVETDMPEIFDSIGVLF